jgi:hypothetical protein
VCSTFLYQKLKQLQLLKTVGLRGNTEAPPGMAWGVPAAMGCDFMHDSTPLEKGNFCLSNLCSFRVRRTVEQNIRSTPKNPRQKSLFYTDVRTLWVFLHVTHRYQPRLALYTGRQLARAKYFRFFFNNFKCVFIAKGVYTPGIKSEFPLRWPLEHGDIKVTLADLIKEPNPNHYFMVFLAYMRSVNKVNR